MLLFARFQLALLSSKSTSFAAIRKAFIAGLSNDLPAGIYAFSGSALMGFPTLAAQFSQALTI
jgi:hypothetical protein